jgi:hypothetical protein
MQCFKLLWLVSIFLISQTSCARARKGGYRLSLPRDGEESEHSRNILERRLDTKKSKRSKNSEKGGSKISKGKGSKSSKSGKSGKGDSSVAPSYSPAPTVSASPTASAAPTCLECDDGAFVQLSQLEKNRPVRPPAARGTIFVGSLLVVMLAFSIFGLLYGSYRRGEQQLSESVILVGGKQSQYDADTVLEEDSINEKILSP